ncbi:hypothetical protein COO60DRAFT_443433 [Scenedesmus sp. NREL 46B-D3]|nr:hypothetical protein COO60DRAFT_443433 [Scenedesmus sp. NREL 46B-D3]
MARPGSALVTVLVLAGSILSITAAPQSPNAISREWANYNMQRQNLRIGTEDNGNNLRSVLDYSFTTPLRQIQGSQVYQAGNARFRRVVDDLQRGNPVTIVAIGGVATNGSDASNPGTNDFFALYVKYLRRAFPNARIEPVRSSAGIAPSAVVAQCLSSYIPRDADLVLLEMTANDAVGMDESLIDGHNAKAYELLMRGILEAEKQPALILTQSMVPGMGNGSTPFYLTPETPQYAALASYYGTPVVSMRNAVWRSGTPTNASGIISDAVLQEDGSTPTNAGHKSMADMLVYNTQRTAEDLALLPYGDYDTQSMAVQVPEKPVYGDVAAQPSVVLSNSTCEWVHDISGNSRQCPTQMDQMCNLDHANRDNMLRTYDERIETSPRSNRAALIGGVVGGVVGGLLLIGGLLAYCIISKKRHAQRVAAAAEAKAAARRKEVAAGQGVPITATTRPGF